jgi:hypothetical protein
MKTRKKGNERRKERKEKNKGNANKYESQQYAQHIMKKKTK